jgi:hypothetical protein
MLGHGGNALDVYADLFEDDLDQVADRRYQAAMRGADYLRTAGSRTPLSTCSKEEAQADDLGFTSEPPDGIEPSTYALRVRRSSRLS